VRPGLTQEVTTMDDTYAAPQVLGIEVEVDETAASQLAQMVFMLLTLVVVAYSRGVI
jgi:hypothetical protein